MQHSARDPLRNSEYGRIYRITYPIRPLVDPPVIAGASIEVLFENLKTAGDERPQAFAAGTPGPGASGQVLAAAEAFAKANRADERLQLEALWATWGQQRRRSTCSSGASGPRPSDAGGSRASRAALPAPA